MSRNRLELIANHLRPLQTIDKVILNQTNSEFNPFLVSTKVRPSSNLIYCSCNIGYLGNSAISNGSLLEQFRESIKHIEKALFASKSNMDCIIKIQVYLTNPQDTEFIDMEISKMFADPSRPHRVYLYVKELPGGAKIGIDVLASQLNQPRFK